MDTKGHQITILKITAAIRMAVVWACVVLGMLIGGNTWAAPAPAAAGNDMPYWHDAPKASGLAFIPGLWMTLSANAAPSPSNQYGPVTYRWTGPNGLVVQNNTRETTLQIQTNDRFVTGDYTCTATNAAGKSISASVYIHFGSCGLAHSQYLTRDNYRGYWDNDRTWLREGTWLPQRPGTRPLANSVSIYGTIFVHGDLEINGSNQALCDTLVVEGKLKLTNPTMTIASTGVLIVLGDLESPGHDGAIHSEGAIIIRGNFSDRNGKIKNEGGKVYVFDDTPEHNGLRFTGRSEEELKARDHDLYRFYCSVSHGDCAPDPELLPPELKTPGQGVTCIPPINSFNEFRNAASLFPDVFSKGGQLNHTNLAVRNFKASDNYEDGKCPKRVVRTYLVELQDGTKLETQQTFLFDDRLAPVINNGQPIGPVSVEATACPMPVTIHEPVVSDNCGYGWVDVKVTANTQVSNLQYDANTKQVSGRFPVGSTTLTWTVTDLGGNVASATQEVSVFIPMSPIEADPGASITGAGSGLFPMKTSTHTYRIDGGVTQPGYSYRWSLTDQAGRPVSPSNYTLKTLANGTTISLQYGQNLAEGRYQIRVTKSNGCSQTENLVVEVISNRAFDVALLPNGDFCQNTGVNGVSVITWEVSFPEVNTEPFKFNYRIELDRAVVCTGAVSGIVKASTQITATSGCAATGRHEPPFMVVEKLPGTNKIRLTYTVANNPRGDLRYRIQIDASDRYEVTESRQDNNAESLNGWKTPDENRIQVKNQQ